MSFSDNFSGFLRKLRLLPPVQDDEVLARYVFSRRDIKSGRVRTRVFLVPNGHRGLSVFRIRELFDSDIQLLGERMAARRTRSLHGRADISGSDVRSVDLVSVPTWPPRRHAELRGWPAQKDARLSIAQRLATIARLTRYGQNT